MIGQIILNVTDSKFMPLVHNEPFWLTRANLLRYDRRLNTKAGTFNWEILWNHDGKQVLITFPCQMSFAHWHVAATSYRVVF